MGRFASTVEFYSRYREPYPPGFFSELAQSLVLTGAERLLDVGCGPGPLSLGLAPFVGRVTGLDPEPAMIDAAKAAASEARVPISFILGRIEDFSTAETFDIITIGRALHWLDRDKALPVLERIVACSGRIAICRAPGIESPVSPWFKRYEDIRRAWSSEGSEYQKHRHQDGRKWFEGSRFVHISEVSVRETRQVNVPELVGRALSKSNTSPAKLGDRRATFEAEITAALRPFSHNGLLKEQIVAQASVFARQQ
jgi:SAM-dependent methyltransferase